MKALWTVLSVAHVSSPALRVFHCSTTSGLENNVLVISSEPVNKLNL